MTAINNGFFFVIDLIISLESHFHSIAYRIGMVVFALALCLMALNHALSGGGGFTKENMIKLGKALAFFFIIMHLYPAIVSGITEWSFSMAKDSMYTKMQPMLMESKQQMAETALDNAANNNPNFGSQIMMSSEVSEEQDPIKFFPNFIQKRKIDKIQYVSVAPGAVLTSVLIVGGSVLQIGKDRKYGITEVGAAIADKLMAILLAALVIFTGCFGVLEYVVAYLEFSIVAAVGIILFPFSIWDGSKFLSEKFVQALIGFFVKLLICNICIFLMLWGFLSIAKTFVNTQNASLFDSINLLVQVVFECLLFFFISKSAAPIAQSLMTGTPSLNGAGAIGAIASGVAAAAGAATLAVGAGKMAAQGGYAGASLANKTAGAMNAVKESGGTFGQTLRAGASAVGDSAKEAVKAKGQDLKRSILGKKKDSSGGGSGGGGGGGGGGQGTAHNQRKEFVGNNETLQENMQRRKTEGKEFGQQYASRHGLVSPAEKQPAQAQKQPDTKPKEQEIKPDGKAEKN